MKIALVHDYLNQKGGAERVFELLCKRFPDADIYTSLYDPESSIDLEERGVRTTPLQNIPGASRFFRLLAPLYFAAFRMLDLHSYDLVLTSTSSFAKAVRTRQEATHVCFCHNVTRFLWDTETYLEGYLEYKTFYPLFKPILRYLKHLDYKYAQEPDLYIANSSTVAKRIRSIYQRPAEVVNYPIDESQFEFSAEKDDYYLVSSRLLSYKRIDIIVEAFNQLGWPLIIIGDGPERMRLQEKAAENITFLGFVSDQRRKQLMAKARFVIVAALEDYGLVPIEANVSGTPVISYGSGGVLDTQIPGMTGLFFERQTPESLVDVLHKATSLTWNSHVIRKHALEYYTIQPFYDSVDRILEAISQEVGEGELAA